MAHLDPQILGRNLDGESRAEILNIAKLTLSNAAAATGEAVRFDEYNTAVTGLDTRLTTVENSNMHLDAVYVDTTSADLAAALATATWNAVDEQWEFPGGINLATGDLLILNAATQQDSDRSWVMNNTKGGTAADFTALDSDIDAAIAAAIASLKGDAAADYDTLGKIEDKHIALDARVTTAEGEIDTLQTEQALRPELRTFSGTFTGPVDGVYTATVAHTFNSTKLHIELQHDEGAGVWEYVDSSIGYTTKVTTTNIEVQTESSTLAASTLRLVVTGIEDLA